MDKIKDVQQLINDKADKKLKDQVYNLQRSIQSGEFYNLILNIRVNIGTAEKPKSIPLYSIFSTDGFFFKIIENNTERYRAKEAEEFMSKVESLREDADNLLDNVRFKLKQITCTDNLKTF